MTLPRNFIDIDEDFKRLRPKENYLKRALRLLGLDGEKPEVGITTITRMPSTDVLTRLRQAGRNPDTERFLRAFKPDLGEREMRMLWPTPSPAISEKVTAPMPLPKPPIEPTFPAIPIKGFKAKGLKPSDLPGESKLWLDEKARQEAIKAGENFYYSTIHGSEVSVLGFPLTRTLPTGEIETVNPDTGRFPSDEGKQLRGERTVSEMARERIQEAPGISGAVARVVTAPLFNIAGIGVSSTDIVSLGALGFGAYQGIKTLIPLTKEIGNKVLNRALNVGLDRWIAQRSRGVPPQQFKTAQDWLYGLIAKDRVWLQERATENMLRRQGRTPNVAQAAREAVADTIRDIETTLVPRGTQTGAMALGGKPKIPPSGQLPEKIPPVTQEVIEIEPGRRWEIRVQGEQAGEVIEQYGKISVFGAGRSWEMSTRADAFAKLRELAIEHEKAIARRPPSVPPEVTRARPPARHEVPEFGEPGAIPTPSPPDVAKAGRRRVIEERLKRGEPVPDRLLAEFPDLQTKIVGGFVAPSPKGSVEQALEAGIKQAKRTGQNVYVFSTAEGMKLGKEPPPFRLQHYIAKPDGSYKFVPRAAIPKDEAAPAVEPTAVAETPEQEVTRLAEGVKAKLAAEPPPVKPPTSPIEQAEIPLPPPIKPTPLSENVIGLRTIEPGLTRSEVAGNVVKRIVNNLWRRVVGKEFMVEADPMANPAFRERDRVKVAIESNANVLGTKADTSIKDTFKLDKKGRVPALVGINPDIPGAPTIQDIAARYPTYENSLTPTQKEVLLKIKEAVEPYRKLLEEVGVEIPKRPDVMEGGFYLPRGRAALEGADEPLKVTGARRGLKKGFERPTLFDSQAEGIGKGYEYADIGETLTAYAYDAGIRATDAHIANYFKTLTDETGQLIGETVKQRLMRQNPEIAKVIEEINNNLTKLKRNIGALEKRQLDVIDMWQNDPDFTDIDDLLFGLETMRGGTPAMTKPELKALYQQNMDALRDLRPSYKVALRRAQVTPREQGVIIMPALQGRTYPDILANAANNYLKKQGPTVGALSPVVNVINAYNNFYRGVRATLDDSVVGIQGLLGMYGNPRGYAGAFKLHVNSWVSDQALGRFLEEFDASRQQAGRLTPSDWARAGGHIAGAGGTEFSFGIGTKIGQVPVVKQANRAFTNFGDVLRLLWWDNELRTQLAKGRTLEQIKVSGDLEKIAEAGNVMTGWARNKAFGSVGELVLFAPRFLQSRLATVTKGAMGLRPNATIDQRMARNALLKMIAIGTLLTIAANEALGNETDFRPIVDGKRNSKFMRIKFGGRHYSLFGTWDSLLGAFINVGTGKPLRALRSMSSGIVANAWDVITGRDYNYKAVMDTAAHFAQWVMSSFIPFSLSQMPEGAKQFAGGVIEGDVQETIGGATVVGTQIIGVKSYSSGEREALGKLESAFKQLGTFDKEGLAEALEGIESPAKRNEIRASKKWIYDIASLRQDINTSTARLDSFLRTEENGFPGYVDYYWGHSVEREFYTTQLTEKQKLEYQVANLDFVAAQFFWGYWTDWAKLGNIEIANEAERRANQYHIPLELIPAFGKTESGKDRLPPRALWDDYFAYYAIWKGEEKTDSADARKFRESHPEFEKWGEANLGWKPLTTSGTRSSGVRSELIPR